MAENDQSGGFSAFGFELKRVNKDKDEKKVTSIVPKVDEDGAGYVTASGSYFGQYIDMEGGSAKDNHGLITKYRQIAEHPEVDAAIEDILNESIVAGELESIVALNLDKVDTSDKIKNTLLEEFDNIVGMLNFENTVMTCSVHGMSMVVYITTLWSVTRTLKWESKRFDLSMPQRSARSKR